MNANGKKNGKIVIFSLFVVSSIITQDKVKSDIDYKRETEQEAELQVIKI